jgi:hypothetical protein
MAHPLGLKDVSDAQVVKPGLMTVAKAVGGQAGAQRKPAREGDGLGGRLFGAGTAFRAELVPNKRAVLSELDCPGAGGATAEAVLTGKPGYPPAGRRRVWLAGNR